MKIGACGVKAASTGLGDKSNNGVISEAITKVEIKAPLKPPVLTF
jgi:hypothetical protein